MSPALEMVSLRAVPSGLWVRVLTTLLSEYFLSPEAIEATVDAMIRFEKALGKYVKKLK